MSVQKRTWEDPSGRTRAAWRVRYQEGDQWRSETFERKADADARDAEIKRLKRLGQLARLDAGTETLERYMADVWIPTYWAVLGEKTQRSYKSLYAVHLKPTFGTVPLRDLTPEAISRWQADRLSGGAGKASTQKALTLLGNILQRAAEAGRVQSNPVRLVRKAKVPKPREIMPLAPSSVEAIRRAMRNPAPVAVAASAEGKRPRRAHMQPAPGTPADHLRDATLVSVLAYAGLRPGEALRLTWGDVRDATLLVEAPKTNTARTVRLLKPLASDLREWRLMSRRPKDSALVFPGIALDNWRSRRWDRAVTAAGVDGATPYTLRHSFASLLLHEGRSVIYVARQLGHGAELTLGTYGHVIDELEDLERVTAEASIEAARATPVAHQLPMGSAG